MRCGRPCLRKVAFSRLLQPQGKPAHVGAIYELPTRRPPLFPEKVAGSMFEVPEFCHGLLYRKSTMLLHQYLARLAQPGPRQAMLRELRADKPGFLLTGPHGVGKSILLSQCVQFARALDILTLYIPDCHGHTHGNLYIEPSALLRGYFDTPPATESFFKTLRQAQPHILQRLPYQSTPPLPVEAPEEEQPTTLLALVNWGLRRPDRLGILLKLFFDAVTALEEEPVLLAIDGYNWFFHDTEYHFGQASLVASVHDVPRVHADQLAIVRQVTHLLRRAETADNLLVVAAVDTSHYLSEETPFHPELTLLHPFAVEPYSELELRTVLDYYLRSGPYAPHYRDPESTVLPTLDRLCYKVGFLSNFTGLKVWRNVLALPLWAYP